MSSSRTFASVAEPPLAVTPPEARCLPTRLEVARQEDGACLGESLKLPELPLRSECHQVGVVSDLVLLRLARVKSTRKEVCPMGAQSRNSQVASASDLAFAPSPLPILSPPPPAS
jgi:hypothetical protein